MGIVKTSEVGPNDGVNLNLTSGPGGYVYVNGQIITGSGSVIIGPQGDTGATGSVGDTGATGATGPKGDTGNQGIPGIDGAVAPAGLTWSGIWNGTQSYFKNYVVGYGSASWWSKNDIPAKPFPLSPNLSPDIDSTNWAFLSIQGPVGPQGFRGATGPQGPTGIGVPGLAGINGATGATGAGSTLQQVTDEGNTIADSNYSQIIQANMNVFTDLTTSEQVSYGIDGMNKNDSSGFYNQQINFEAITSNGTLIIPNTNGKLTTEEYVDAEISAAVVGLLDDRGNYDASSNTFPSSGGSGTAGAILKGDLWTISVAGTLGGVAVTIGDVIRAKVDAPGSTSSNWVITENNIGYVPENNANKSNDLADSGSTTKFPVWAIIATYITNALASFKTANFLDFTSSGQTQLDAKSDVIFSDGVTATGIAVTTEQKLKSYLIPANRIADKSNLLLNIRFHKTGGGGAPHTLRVYVNTSDTLVGATLIGFYSLSVTTVQEFGFQRTITIKGSNLSVMNTSVSSTNDLVTSNTSPSTIPFNRAIDQFLIISVQTTAGHILQITMANLIKN